MYSRYFKVQVFQKSYGDLNLGIIKIGQNTGSYVKKYQKIKSKNGKLRMLILNKELFFQLVVKVNSLKYGDMFPCTLAQKWYFSNRTFFLDLETNLAVSWTVSLTTPCNISFKYFSKKYSSYIFDGNSQTILAQCFISISPKNIRKPKVFWHFKGVQRWNIGLKWVKYCRTLLTKFQTKWKIELE